MSSSEGGKYVQSCSKVMGLGLGFSHGFSSDSGEYVQSFVKVMRLVQRVGNMYRAVLRSWV